MPPRQLDHRHHAMRVFLGTWNVSGQNAPSAPGAGSTQVAGSQRYEWLAGQFFLLSHWDRSLSDGERVVGEHHGTGIIGVDDDGPAYAAHHFDNLGFARRYIVTVREREWTFSGKHERAIIEFSTDGSTFRERWEIAPDGGEWQPLCNLLGTRAG